MKQKVFKQTTIIPKDLYISRGADRQLRGIIQDMGRPGFILVARQMGKTNLLIQAKRELENHQSVFVYVDCTTLSASDARSCFRSIIDVAIETNSARFQNAADEIHESRKQQNLSAHKEHEAELRILFHNFSGKIVIILDEIDALTNSEFSDQIFAQIRSIYFTRVNYIEFERLTYILSGVLEPVDIIKDKNRSPFNIGEKIYLGDFTFEEHEQFVSKLGDEISKEVKDRIYYWTKGNPRITWDICSALEDEFINGQTVNESTVDTTVDKLYLRNFDLAPIDHIRNLVQTDKELRQSLRIIHAGNSDKIGKKAARQLYLAGIIESDLHTSTHQIKNKIIESSLTVEWLDEIDQRTKNLHMLAAEELQSGNYQKALEHYLEYYSNVETHDSNLLRVITGAIADCYYSLRKFTDSLPWYELALEKTDKTGAPDDYYGLVYTIGLNNLILGNYKKSVERFKDVVDNYSLRADIYYRSFLNLASSYYELDYDKNKERALEDYMTIVKEIDDHKFANENLKRHIKQIALMNIGIAEKQDEQLDNATKHFMEALSLASKEHKPRVLIELFELAKSSEQRSEHLQGAIDSIIIEKLNLGLDLEDPFLLERNLLKKIIAYCYKIKNIELATKILFYSLNEIFNNKSTKEEILYDVALYATNELKDYVVSEIIFKELIEEFSAQEDVILMRSYRSLGLIRYSLQNKEYHSEFEKYVFLLRKNRNFDQSLSPDDFNAALYYIVYLREQENILGALEICKLFVSFENKIGNKPPLDFLLIYFLYAQTSHLLNLREEALSYAKKTLALIDSNKLSKDMPIDHQGINTIHRELNKIVKHYSISQFIEDPFRKIGRNKLIKVRYVDGSVKEEKFKKLENDLRLNNCTLIEG